MTFTEWLVSQTSALIDLGVAIVFVVGVFLIGHDKAKRRRHQNR
jgi:hypothetical protein